MRTEPYSDAELGAHDRKLAKYFVGGSLFLVLGSAHMVLKNVPWIAESLARMGYAGHLVRDLASTHVMIVGGGDVARNRPVLARAAEDRRTSPHERGPCPVRVLVHRRRARAVLRLARRQRDRDRPPGGAWLGLSARQGAPGQVVQGSHWDRRRRHGPRLLVLRGERLHDDFPVRAWSRSRPRTGISGSFLPPVRSP